MSMVIAEIYEALVEAGASEEKAKAAAGAVPAGENPVSKADIQELRTAFATKAEIHAIKAGIQELWSEVRVLKFAVFSLYPFILAMTYRIFSWPVRRRCSRI